MNDLRKAAEELIKEWDWECGEHQNKALAELIEALRQALAQPDDFVYSEDKSYRVSPETGSFGIGDTPSKQETEWIEDGFGTMWQKCGKKDCGKFVVKIGKVDCWNGDCPEAKKKDMKIYCELCKKVQPVRIDICRDAKTNEPYQDIVCAECDFVIASGTGIAQSEQYDQTALELCNVCGWKAIIPDEGCLVCARKEQEPVMWSIFDGKSHDVFDTKYDADNMTRFKNGKVVVKPLYTAPPKREWVGLTDEDLKPLCDEWRIMYGGYVDDFAKAIEAKLKEKNT